VKLGGLVIMNQLFKSASYLRLSKEDNLKLDESSSISSQRIIIESFAKFNNLNIVGEYVDDGYTGGNFNRPAFQKMIDDINNGKINCVITKDLSRLGREMYQTGGYIEDYFIDNGVRYIAINDSYDSQVGDSMLGIRLGVNDLYLRDISKKVKSSMRAKQQSGKYIGSYPCYGYKKDPKDRHHLIPDTKVVPIVKMIYELALSGYGINTICNKLTDMRIPIPIVYKGELRGKLVTDNDGYGIWKHSTVKNILTSQMYIGNMVQHTYEKTSYRSKKLRKVNDDELIIVNNTHEPIISREDFDKVQEILKSKSGFTRLKDKKYLFSGLLKCKECGASLSISEKKTKSNNYRYTQCNLYKRKGKYGKCTLHRLNYNWLEEDLLALIRNICDKFLQDYDYEGISKKVKNINDEMLNELTEKLETINIDLVRNNNFIENLYKDKCSGLLREEDYEMMYKNFSTEVKNLKSKKITYEEKLRNIELELSGFDYEGCRNVAKEFMSMKKPTRNILSRIIQKIEINENKEVDMHFNFKELTYINK
jgi:DNA invertase Pin-like site-specific DNA recombinase